MWRTNYEQYTSNWHEIQVNLRFKLHDVLKWCDLYESPRGFFIDYNDARYKCPLRMKFESQEDLVMFMMVWLNYDN